MENYMAIGGGIFLSGYGVALMLKKVDAQKDAQVDIHLNDKSYLKSYFNGFVINSLNPAVIPLWAGVIIKMQRNLSSDKSIVITFFISLMLTIFITDISKALLAFRLKSFITNKVIWWMNKSIGTIMLIAGGRMLYTLIK
jgi:threonine/homoserine/homoserine lactone efflux protein